MALKRTGNDLTGTIAIIVDANKERKLKPRRQRMRKLLKSGPRKNWERRRLRKRNSELVRKIEQAQGGSGGAPMISIIQ